MKGTVKWFNAEKGYGFIVSESGEELFAHYSQIQIDGYKTLNENEQVEFDVITESRGPQASNIRVIK